jgi:hypothetical protein
LIWWYSICNVSIYAAATAAASAATAAAASIYFCIIADVGIFIITIIVKKALYKTIHHFKYSRVYIAYIYIYIYIALVDKWMLINL